MRRDGNKCPMDHSESSTDASSSHSVTEDSLSYVNDGSIANSYPVHHHEQTSQGGRLNYTTQRRRASMGTSMRSTGSLSLQCKRQRKPLGKARGASSSGTHVMPSGASVCNCSQISHQDRASSIQQASRGYNGEGIFRLSSDQRKPSQSQSQARAETTSFAPVSSDESKIPLKRLPRRGSTGTHFSSSSSPHVTPTGGRKVPVSIATKGDASIRTRSINLSSIEDIETESNDATKQQQRGPVQPIKHQNSNEALERDRVPPRQGGMELPFVRRGSVLRAEQLLGLDGMDHAAKEGSSTENLLGDKEDDEWLTNFLNEGYHKQKEEEPEPVKLDLSCLDYLYKDMADPTTKNEATTKTDSNDLTQITLVSSEDDDDDEEDDESTEEFRLSSTATRKLETERFVGHRKPRRKGVTVIKTLDLSQRGKPELKRNSSF